MIRRHSSTAALPSHGRIEYTLPRTYRPSASVSDSLISCCERAQPIDLARVHRRCIDGRSADEKRSIISSLQWQIKLLQQIYITSNRVLNETSDHVEAKLQRRRMRVINVARHLAPITVRCNSMIYNGRSSRSVVLNNTS